MNAMRSKSKDRRSPVTSSIESIPVSCLVGFLIVWALVAIAPKHRLVWAVENVLVVPFVVLLIATYHRFRFSGRAYLQMTAFLLLHTVATHSSYAEAPLGVFIRDALQSDRNPYDRLAHFSFGFFMLRPLRELVMRCARDVGARVELTVAYLALGFAAMFYELIEWAVAVLAVTSAGVQMREAIPTAVAFLAIQNDAWDVHKDMALACLGGLLAMSLEVRGLSWTRSGSPGARRESAHQQ